MAKLVYCYHHANYPKGLYVKPHFHKNYEIVYYLKGKGVSRHKPNAYQVTSNDGMSLYVAEQLDDNCPKLNFQEGSFIVYPPLTTHDEKHLIGGGDIMVLGFKLEDTECPLPVFSCSDSALHIKNTLLKIIRENREKQADYALMLDVLTTELAISLNRLISTPKENSIDVISQAIQYIDDYFISYIDLESLSQSIGYSPDYFRHLFRNTTGLSPKQYIQEKRISLAKQQLLHTDISLTEVAKNCGYEDYAQFSAYFKKQTGVSPNHFRDRNREK